ncbi:DUF4350 domain-containing protein [Mucilaginibacter sp. PAMB04168]|uniref:DUF4350 domain-containing protein n=1 Tax=Mucilaginibacter sp. PAMB04168 TaxID=3138567 RepID=UPI0031F5FFB5
MKDFKVITWIGAILLAAYLIAEYNKPKPVNWQSTLSYGDKIPFGTYVLHQQLVNLYPTGKVIRTNEPLYNALHQKNLQGNYFIIAKTIDLTKYDYAELVKFIKAGNNVFMSAFVWDGILPDTLKLHTNAEYGKSNVAVNLANPQLKRAANYTFQRDICNQYFSRFDTAHAVVLGQNSMKHANYLSFAFGKGHLYLSANPQLFTNYSLLSDQGADYAAKALSYLPAAANVYWDQYQNKDIPFDNSPLRVIFSHDSLRWAYYISLITALVYIIYEAKRRQRIILVIEPLRNNTLDFVNVVGQVYYEQRDNSNIAHKKITYLLEHWRTAYYLKTSVLNKEFTDALANKTGIEPAFARELVNLINYTHVQHKVTDSELIALNQAIENFYSQTGK